MKTDAMSIPVDQLMSELERRRDAKLREQELQDARRGPDRVHVTSYMENIGWPELFGYEMSRIQDDPEFAAAQRLREIIFWADNVNDDTVPEAAIQADVGMYWDMTLFGMKIHHSPIGVPEFEPHAFQRGIDLDALGKFDFYQTGDMPRIRRKYVRLRELSASRYGGKLSVTFPCFQRGPLDIFIQLRGYEGFIDDLAERPDDLRAALSYLVDERIRFARERQTYLGETTLPTTCFVADDWVNIPFVSHTFFREHIVPLYKSIRAHEGPVRGFHTCGNFLPVAMDVISVFPEIDMLEVSPWNDVAALDHVLPPKVGFIASVLNTVSLGGNEDEQRGKLEPMRDASRRRKLTVVAQAIQRMQPTYEETLVRLDRFLELTRRLMYS